MDITLTWFRRCRRCAACEPRRVVDAYELKLKVPRGTSEEGLQKSLLSIMLAEDTDLAGVAITARATGDECLPGEARVSGSRWQGWRGKIDKDDRQTILVFSMDAAGGVVGLAQLRRPLSGDYRVFPW